MSFTLAELALRMDPIAPPTSLRLLAERHRWPLLPDRVSFQALLRRHEHEQTTEHRLLWYNTYLIHGFQIELCNLVLLGALAKQAKLEARQVVLMLALDPRDVVDVLGISDSALVDSLGINLGALKDAFPGVVDTLVSVVTLGQVDISVSDILDKVSPRDLVEAFGITVEQIIDGLGIDPLEILKAFCDRAIALFDSIFGFGLGASFFAVGDAPQRHERSLEIGTMLAAEYHIAALCEVFEADKQANITSQIAAAGRSVQPHVGPDQNGEFAGSGLQTVIMDGRTAVSDDAVFSFQGDRLRDADAWSRKGVLRTVVDVGVGQLEIYSTHLFNGGGILEFDGSQAWHATVMAAFPPLSEEERLKIQLDQVLEVVAFIRSTHQPRNVAMLLGDFNINANDAASSTALRGVLAQLADVVDFIDLWPFWNQQSATRVRRPRGDSVHPETVCATPDAPFCSEPAQPGTTERIDYLFVQRPVQAHSFVLDVTRIRRRAFRRGPGSFLSDHLGLDLWLICSPKEHIPA